MKPLLLASLLLISSTAWAQMTEDEVRDGIVIGRSAYEFRQTQRNKIWNKAYSEANWLTRHFGNVCPNCPVPEDKTTYTEKQQKECDDYLKSVFGDRYSS